MSNRMLLEIERQRRVVRKDDLGDEQIFNREAELSIYTARNKWIGRLTKVDMNTGVAVIESGQEEVWIALDKIEAVSVVWGKEFEVGPNFDLKK